MRKTWDAAASTGTDLVVGDPLRAREEVALLLGRLGIEAADRAVCLEVGCGPARMTVELARRFGQVIAVDVSPLMLLRARRRLAEHGIRNVTLQLVSGTRLDGICDGAADVVVSYETLQHLPTRRLVGRYLAEFVRVLAPSGQAVVQIPVLEAGGRARLWRLARAVATPTIACFSRSLLASPAYRGSRLTPYELRAALDRAGARVVTVTAGRDWRVGNSSFTHCHEIFLRFERAPASVFEPAASRARLRRAATR